MRQKLAFCCAWLPRPRLRPARRAALGPRPARHPLGEARDPRARARRARRVILSSHLLELIEELAARILILDRGRKVFAGTLARGAHDARARARAARSRRSSWPPPTAARRRARRAGRRAERRRRSGRRRVTRREPRDPRRPARCACSRGSSCAARCASRCAASTARRATCSSPSSGSCSWRSGSACWLCAAARAGRAARRTSCAARSPPRRLLLAAMTTVASLAHRGLVPAGEEIELLLAAPVARADLVRYRLLVELGPRAVRRRSCSAWSRRATCRTPASRSPARSGDADPARPRPGRLAARRRAPRTA